MTYVYVFRVKCSEYVCLYTYQFQLNGWSNGSAITYHEKNFRLAVFIVQVQVGISKRKHKIENKWWHELMVEERKKKRYIVSNKNFSIVMFSVLKHKSIFSAKRCTHKIENWRTLESIYKIHSSTVFLFCSFYLFAFVFHSPALSWVPLQLISQKTMERTQ